MPGAGFDALAVRRAGGRIASHDRYAADNGHWCPAKRVRLGSGRRITLVTRNVRTPPDPMNSAERTARDWRIARARAAGDSFAAIAEREGITERHARRAAAAGLRDGPTTLTAIDPAAIAARVVQAQQDALERLHELSRDGDNTAAMVGAARGAATVGAALLDSLRAAGLLAEPRAMWRVLDMREATVALLDLAVEAGIDRDELIERIPETPALRPALTLGAMP
jgi:hypothetical protein